MAFLLIILVVAAEAVRAIENQLKLHRSSFATGGFVVPALELILHNSCASVATDYE